MKDRWSRWAWALVAVGLLVYAVLLFHPLAVHLFRGGPAAWIEGDVPEEYWPDLVVLCRGLAHAHLPRWNPHEHGGAPFYADPQAGAYYPLNWALCALAGPSPSSRWADLRTVLHFWLGCVFMAAFLRGEGLGWVASLTGACLFPLTPFMRHNWELNLTAGFAWLPLLLLLGRAVARDPTPLRGAVLGVAAAMTALAGSPPALFYAGLVAGPFTVHAAFQSLRDGVPWRRLARAAGVATAVALALSLPMIAPARELAGLSVRAKPDLAMIAEGGLDARQILGAVLPALGDHVYVGLLGLGLAIWALCRPTYPAVRLFAAVGATGLLLELGDRTLLFRLVYAAVPGAATFRDPARYSALWGTSALVLAAAGLDAMLKARVLDAARWRWARYGGLFALGCILVGEVPGLDPYTHGDGLVFAGLILATGTVALTFAPGARLTGLLAGALCCADLFATLPEGRHTRAGPFPFPESTATLTALREVAAASGEDLDGYRTWDEFGIHMRSGSRYGLRDFRGYQDPLSLGRYQKVIGELWRSPLLLATFNVRWVLWAPHYLHGEGHHFLADPSRGTWAVLRAPRVYEIPSALPMAYWTSSVEVAPDADAALERVRAAAPSAVAVLEAGSGVEAAPGSGSPVPARVTRGTETITVEVEAPTTGMVVVNESFYPGWEARVDGREAAVYRANSLVMGVRVPVGVHRIEMAFRPWQPRVFEPIAAAAVVAVVVLWVRSRVPAGSTGAARARP
jgi:hypothetical protein